METAVEPTEKNNQTEESTLKEKRVQERELVVWTAPARPFRRRDRQFYLTTVSIAGIVCLILFLAEGVMPVILIISLLFLYYVLSTVEPENIEYKITTNGVKVAGRLTPWDFLGRFWFSTRNNAQLLVFETFVMPGRMELVINSEVKEKIRKALQGYLIEEQIPPSSLDKAIDWFSRKLPQ